MIDIFEGDYAHCGFPEIAFSRFADALVSKGNIFLINFHIGLINLNYL
jgi:hypothetical protein